MDYQFSVLTKFLAKSYGDTKAVVDLNLAVPPGEFFGFLGPNGAGKSTTIKILCGLIKPTGGTAEVVGYDCLKEPLLVKQNIGILPEEINTYERLTGWELLYFTGRIYGLGKDETRRRAGDLLDLMELDDQDRNKMIVDYSLGMKKKVSLACALIHSPKVLFLDEPFNGIDAVTSQAIRHVLRQATEKGVTIFFSSHVMDVVERLCSTIGIINEGRLVTVGDIDEIRRRAQESGDATLEDVFVKLVRGDTERKELDWLK